MPHPSNLDGDGRQVISTLMIKTWSDGALSIEGPIDDEAWCMAVLDNARDAVKNRLHRRGALTVPARDVTL